VGFALFVAVAVGWRLWFQYRTTGDAGVRLPRAGLGERVAALLFVVGFALAPLSAARVLLGGSVTEPGDRLLLALGSLALASGFALTLTAQLAMGASWRIGVDRAEDTALVTCGVFARVRNPIYTGILLVLSGMLLLVPGAPAVAALGCTWLALQIQVRAVEEPHLARTHGDEYRAWARRTGRFVPGVGRMR
jgi:protein-S-isoprenylcysteine O-methyltransferase Ste14